MFKSVVNLFLFLSFVSILQAQSSENEIVKSALRDFSVNSYMAIMSDRFAKSKGYEKSNLEAVLLFPDYVDATVHFYEGNPVTSKLNYFIEDDVFIFEKDGQVLQLNGKEIKKVVFSNKYFYNIKYKDRKKIKTHFFEILHESSNMVLLKMVKIISKRKTKGPLMQASQIEIKKERSFEFYYLLPNDKFAVKVPKRIKKMRTIFGSKYEVIVEYIEENKINVKKEKDLINLLDRFYGN